MVLQLDHLRIRGSLAQHARAITAALLALGGSTAAAQPAAEGTKTMTRSITVTASAHIAAEPDRARISSGVSTEADTAREALNRNSDTMRKLIDGLKSLGIDAKDIATSSLHVEPRYNNPRDGQPSRVIGYRVTNQVTLVQRNLARLGEVLDQLVTLGANQMGGLSFEVSRAETLKDEARKEAIASALRRAKLYASAAGAEVGSVLSISEDTSVVTPSPRGFAMARASAPSAVPVEAGSQELEATVTVTWSLR